MMHKMEKAGIGLFFAVLIAVPGICLIDMGLVTEVDGSVTAHQTSDKGMATWTPDIGETLAEGTGLDVAASGQLKLVHLRRNREITVAGPCQTRLTADGLEGIDERTFGSATARLDANLDLSVHSQQQVGAIDAQTAVALGGVISKADEGKSNADAPEEVPGGVGPMKEETGPADPLARKGVAASMRSQELPKKQENNETFQAIGEPSTNGVADTFDRELSSIPAPAPASALELESAAGAAPVVPPAPARALPSTSMPGIERQKKAVDSQALARTPLLALPSGLVMLKDGAVGLRDAIDAVDAKRKTILLEVLAEPLSEWDVLGIQPGTTFTHPMKLPVKAKDPNDHRSRRFARVEVLDGRTPLLQALEAESRGLLAQAAGLWYRLMREGTVKTQVAQAHLKRLKDKMLAAAGDL